MPSLKFLLCSLLVPMMWGVGACSSGSSAPATEGARLDLAQSAASALSGFKSDARSSKFFDTAYGWAVFPKITKGAAGIGVAQGQGEVYQAGVMTGWVKVTSVTLGAQLGGQSFSEIIFFQDQWAYDKFTNNQFAGQATATAVAGKKGGGQLADYSDGVAVFTRNNDGLILAADVGGQQFDFTPR